jgi:hypothetical protein
MKKSIFAAIVGLVILVLTGCAPVKFYSNPGLTAESGLKYYTVKPFLMVEKDPVNNNVTKATVIYLPDLVNPQYMVIKDGFGSKKVDLKLTDGSINTFGVESDMKIAETINALAALISKGTTAITDLVALKGIPQAAAASTITELYEIFMGPDGTTVKKVEFK